MTLPAKLTIFREYHNLCIEDIAKELNVSVESYRDIENGKMKINGILAQKISDLYRTPIEFFIMDDTPNYLQAEVMYTNCTITSPGGGSSGYINHQYNDRGIDEILYSKKEEIKNLKQQIEYLQQQNNQLIELLGNQIKEANCK